jgi:hypothetical protein
LREDYFIHHFPGRYVTLRWESPDEFPNERQSLDAALKAIDALSVVVQPLAVDFEVVCPDGEPTNSQLRVANSTVGVKPFYEGTTVTEVAQIDRNQLEQWTNTALKCATTTGEPEWTELRIRATCARLSDRWEDGQNLVLLTEGGTTEVQVYVHDGIAWVCGPLPIAPGEPPIGLEFFQDSGVITLNAYLHWSAWTENGSEGRAALSEGLARLQQLEWTMIASDLPGAELDLN